MVVSEELLSLSGVEGESSGIDDLDVGAGDGWRERGAELSRMGVGGMTTSGGESIEDDGEMTRQNNERLG